MPRREPGHKVELLLLRLSDGEDRACLSAKFLSQFSTTWNDSVQFLTWGQNRDVVDSIIIG